MAYRIFCDTESAWAEGEAGPPTTCYNDAGHNVRLDSVQCDHIEYEVTGSRAGNAALASLLTVLVDAGLIVDSTTET